MKERNTVLQVNSSSRFENSITRQVVNLVSQELMAGSEQQLVNRDLTTGIAFINEAWIGANFTAESERSAEQNVQLSFSNELVDEIFAAEYIVIGAPIYNFSIPAVLKAWFDQVARAKLTFEYTQEGPRGLVEGKKAYVVIASGGVAVGSDYDFSSKYLLQVLGFLGISDVQIIDANKIDLTAVPAEVKRQVAASLDTLKVA